MNGAGKTTFFKILTGEIYPTNGNVFINSFDADKQTLRATQNLGYCPQNDYLPSYMTVQETLNLFAKLRGIRSRKMINLNVETIISLFKLNEFSNVLVDNLSGGNKRKVNTAIAFLGKPTLVTLDEPTTGMDPASRRYIWTIINRARELGTTILLTSHSMEECEALCTRIGIMVKGQFQCIGNIQHLKSKYGKGFSLIVKCKSGEGLDSKTKRVDEFLKENFPSIRIKQQKENTLFYEIKLNETLKSSNENSLSNYFKIIESNKNYLDIEAYSISQTTLEDLFLSVVQNC